MYVYCTKLGEEERSHIWMCDHCGMGHVRKWQGILWIKQGEMGNSSSPQKGVWFNVCGVVLFSSKTYRSLPGLLEGEESALATAHVAPD